MRTEDFNYGLDESCIANIPIEPRDASKLIVIDRSNHEVKEMIFSDISNELNENDVLVLNETEVIKARLKWYVILKDWKNKEIEVVLLSQVNQSEWECAVFPWERLKPWKLVYFKDIVSDEILMEWEVQETTYSWRIIKFSVIWDSFFELIDRIWEIPLPHYIKWGWSDLKRYNTVVASIKWSAAAPTAWLHFTNELINKLNWNWVKIEKVLLHVWLWTFKPITAEDPREHQIHEEFIKISKNTAEKLNWYKKDWKRIIAVWTTVARVLESFVLPEWNLNYWEKKTNIFIYPWYEWKFVDSLITNFHLPKSSLLMLVSSFYDRQKLIQIYEDCQKKWYRLMSFWDAMWIK